MPSTALDACVSAKPSRAFGLHCFLCVVCEARLGPPGCYPCRIHRTHGPFGKSSILLFKPVATVKSFLATVCASSLTVLYPYIEQRQGQASSNHRVGLRSRLDLKSRSRKRRPTRLQVMRSLTCYLFQSLGELQPGCRPGQRTLADAAVLRHPRESYGFCARGYRDGWKVYRA
jgi:hypothetical protein